MTSPNDVIAQLEAMKLALESDVDRRDFDLLAETAIHTMDALAEAASLIKTLTQAVETEREECARLIEEGFEREIGEQYLPDRRTKNDKCKHGRYMYEDCEQCAASAIRARSTQGTT